MHPVHLSSNFTGSNSVDGLEKREKCTQESASGKCHKAVCCHLDLPGFADSFYFLRHRVDCMAFTQPGIHFVDVIIFSFSLGNSKGLLVEGFHC